VIKFIDQYSSVMSKNHLIDEIKAYDQGIKDFDKQFVESDNRLIQQLTH